MTHAIFTKMTARVTDFKINLMKTMAAGAGAAVAILNRNKPAFYCVPADEYEALEDAELNAIADERKDGAFVAVSLGEL